MIDTYQKREIHTSDENSHSVFTNIFKFAHVYKCVCVCVCVCVCSFFDLLSIHCTSFQCVYLCVCVHVCVQLLLVCILWNWSDLILNVSNWWLMVIIDTFQKTEIHKIIENSHSVFTNISKFTHVYECVCVFFLWFIVCSLFIISVCVCVRACVLVWVCVNIYVTLSLCLSLSLCSPFSCPSTSSEKMLQPDEVTNNTFRLEIQRSIMLWAQVMSETWVSLSPARSSKSLRMSWCGRRACLKLSQSVSMGTYHGGWQPSCDDSLHSPTVIPPSALDKPSIMKRYHHRQKRAVTPHFVVRRRL